ncbi:MAG: hypothetical protein ACHP9W_03435 [Steroidobacterales bacterium]
MRPSPVGRKGLEYRPHCIRHSAAMQLLQCATGRSVIPRRLGHATPVTMHKLARVYRSMHERAAV